MSIIVVILISVGLSVALLWAFLLKSEIKYLREENDKLKINQVKLEDQLRQVRLKNKRF